MKAPAKSGPSRRPTRHIATAPDKIATCEISRGAGAQDHPTRSSEGQKASGLETKTHPSTLSSAAPLKSKHVKLVTPDEAYDQMRNLRKMDGALVESAWTLKGYATLAACLTAMDAWGDDKTVCDEIRYRLKEERGGRRALNCNNPYLVTIHCCHDKPTRAQRSEFTRFSKVVEVARSQNVKPEDAEGWLKCRTQKSILDESRALKGKKPAATRAVVASKSVRSHIWQAIQAGAGDKFVFATACLDALEKQLAEDS